MAHSEGSNGTVYLNGKLVVRMASLCTRRAENGNAGSDLSECVEALHELGHDFEDLPARMGTGLRPVAEPYFG